MDRLLYSLVRIVRQRAERHAMYRNIVVPVSDTIGWRIIATGQYEATHMDAVRAMVSGKFPDLVVDRNGLCVDVGANVGLYSLLFASLFRKVVAFEASPITAKLLEVNLALAHVSNVQCVPMGLSKKAETATLRTPANGNLGWARISHHENWETFAHTIQVDTLDNLAVELGFANEPVSLIKVDVEGHEAEVLEGAGATIDRWRPAILFEASSQSNLDAVMSGLAKHGYHKVYGFRRTLTGSVIAERLETCSRLEALLCTVRSKQ
jgi:FkbM family methyltransferase